MATQLEDALVVVPAARNHRRLEQALPIEFPESFPARVNIDAAVLLIRAKLPTGESGASFLSTIFFDANRQPRSVTLQEIVEHFSRSSTLPDHLNSSRACLDLLERFENCGLILVTQGGGLLQDRYFLNPARGVSELLQLKPHDGADVLECRSTLLDTAAAIRLLETFEFSSPFRAPMLGADIGTRLLDRKMVSELMNDDALYVDDKARGWSVRQQLSTFLNAGIEAGLFIYEVILRDGQRREVYSVSRDARPLVEKLGKRPHAN